MQLRNEASSSAVIVRRADRVGVALQQREEMNRADAASARERGRARSQLRGTPYAKANLKRTAPSEAQGARIPFGGLASGGPSLPRSFACYCRIHPSVECFPIHLTMRTHPHRAASPAACSIALSSLIACANIWTTMLCGSRSGEGRMTLCPSPE